MEKNSFVSLLEKKFIFNDKHIIFEADLIEHMNIFLYRLELLNFHSVLPFSYEDVVKEFKNVFGDEKKNVRVK